MDFVISEELRSVQQLAAQILGDFTQVDKLKIIEAQPERFDPALWQALAEAGLLGLDIEEAHGGMDLGFYSLSMLCEEVGRSVAPVPVVPVLVGAAGTLRRFGSDAQKDEWLPAIASGKALLSSALGLCDKMMRITGQYTSEREQFGRAIATFQAVSHRVADCYIDVESLRLVTQQAASLIDQERPAEEAANMAKIWCGDVTHRVSQAAQHCHGGTGVDRDYILFRYCLMARQIELSAGNSARLAGELGQSIAREYLAAS